LAALRQDLQRVRDAWAECQATRDRNAIYGYLNAVYGLVAVWAAEGRDVERARRALRLQRLEISERGRSRRSSGAPLIRRRPTNGRGQMVSGYAVRGGVQAGFRAAGPLHSSQGRHQRVRGSFHAAAGFLPANPVIMPDVARAHITNLVGEPHRPPAALSALSMDHRPLDRSI
jgi:hypothetical protein